MKALLVVLLVLAYPAFADQTSSSFATSYSCTFDTKDTSQMICKTTQLPPGQVPTYSVLSDPDNKTITVTF